MAPFRAEHRSLKNTINHKMATPILATKLYLPPPRANLVHRTHLIERLNAGLRDKLLLISAPAGFGKTTLISSWISELRSGGGSGTQFVNRVAWLSLDEEDCDPKRFLTYLVAAVQTIVPDFGVAVLGMLQSPQPPQPATILTTFLNELVTIPGDSLLILDDYHVIDAKPIDDALAFLLEHLPPQMHLVITTREDPVLPLARYRARNQLTELRASDLRFTPEEAANFLNQVMGLNLSATEITALEARTEGWIAGLQLAALSLQGHRDAGQNDLDHFIDSFTGSHRFVMDYLVEEVLHQQPEPIQTFLLRTSILERLCGPLCDALLGNEADEERVATDRVESSDNPPLPIANLQGQAILQYLEQANLFLIPLDNERRWYRYHHLFTELLRQRLHQHGGSPMESASIDNGEVDINELHRRASIWYEAHELEMDAFHHATVANDIGRAERLIEGKGMPLHFRGGETVVLHWLKTLPTTVLNAWPSLWTAYASTLLVTGQTTQVEAALRAADAALQNKRSDGTLDGKTQDLIGRIAAIRSTLAAAQNQVDAIIAHSRLALEYLHPDNLAFRTSTNWKLGYAYHLQGDRVAARQAYTEVIATGKVSGNQIFTLMATIGLAGIQAEDIQLRQALQTYRSVLPFFGDQPLPFASEVHLGLAKLFYAWNDLDVAQQHGQQSIQLAKQAESSERSVVCMAFFARLQLARGDMTGAATMLAEAEEVMRQHNTVYRMAEVIDTQVWMLLHLGELTTAAQLVQTHNFPLSQARVHLAQGDTTTALALLDPLYQQMVAKDWQDETLKVLVLQVIATYLHGETAQALHLLENALALAEPSGSIRLFLDEGTPMARCLSEAAAQGIMPGYVGKLLSAFTVKQPEVANKSPHLNSPSIQPLIEPLSRRELEVLHLVAQGLSNREISERLFLALNTVKGHNRRIFDKLQVQRRTEAVARARELGLL